MFVLLGGYDLEMLEIRKLLVAHEGSFLDAGLNWDTAKWDAYRNEPYLSQIHRAFETGRQVFGIELRGEAIEGCGLIDHHNELQHLPSAIEQVASLMSLELDRRQQLVAANDKGYIPAMMEMGATQEEIDEIRRADRIVQGVTEEEEKRAELDIIKGERVDDLLVIGTGLSRFSPISDKLFGKTSQLLIYSDNSLDYYWKGKDLVADHFKEYIDHGKAYEGGGEFGFFGLSKNALPKEEILAIKDKIVSLTTNLS
ncbi:hypothetical protein SAMN05192553_1182 [Cyclobacterium xiamenense]|uniref:Uncharacterized protein n=2 Tax=Cyclobacterium xiamenense TaxID=1297121 RepID=A0A1H7C819_9BACT|nr:hypothetical protein SAMN05192553_1182 [Cyclobacterium xiamenense]